MKNGKKHLVFGIFIGLVLALLYFHFFAPRYEVTKEGISMLKVDKWSGQTWRYVDSQWKQIKDRTQNWEKIDEALKQALKIPTTGVDSDSALKLLRTKYSILKDIDDEELTERIKLVYSKQILCDLYLNNFIKINSSESAADNK